MWILIKKEQEATNGGSAPLRCAGGLPGPIGSLSETLPQGVATACGNTVACEAPVSGSNTLAHRITPHASGLRGLTHSLRFQGLTLWLARLRFQGLTHSLTTDHFKAQSVLCDCSKNSLQGTAHKTRTDSTFDIPIDSINSMHCLCDLKRLACADSTLRGLF